ncbi:MAG TPA: cadmium-translocating P-type ATPase [Candidatus Scatocola faecigallinarum]|nr:cadmium-translocating P-type ATPase [Candidatus Scatocola faecigallinarum]
MGMKQKRQLYKIIAAAVLFAVAFMLPVSGYWRLAVWSAAYLIVGLPIVRKAFRNIGHGQVFDENFLMTAATAGAFALGEYSEGVAVMLFYQIGELFQSYAVNKSRKSIAALMDIRPDYANIERDGKVVRVSPEDVRPGEDIIVTAGEKIPLDGRIVEGYSLIDTAAITGESVPREAAVGDEVISGCINLNGRLKIKVTRDFGQSTVAKILDLVENASSQKASVENFITRFARYYTPAVVFLALAIAVLPPLLVDGAAFSDWLYRALTFLVISCPCALVISVPLGFFGGIGAASRNGILVKGSNYLEALAATEIAVFDKTGTLTKGCFEVSRVQGEGIDDDTLLETAAFAGGNSTHPVSQSIRKAYGKEIDLRRVADFEELPGRGIKATIGGKTVLLGNKKLLDEYGIKFNPVNGAGTVVYIAAGGIFRGFILIADEIKPDAPAAIAALKKAGIRETVMLTGDNAAVAENVAQTLGLDKFFANLLPAQKVEKVEALMKDKSDGGKLIFAGDGINDAPVLALADIGIAMGGVGSDAAVEAADIVIMTDEPSKIAQAIKISQRTLRIVRQNIVFALGVKFWVLLMGAEGLATMWDAVFADVGVSVIAIINSMRALKSV